MEIIIPAVVAALVAIWLGVVFIGPPYVPTLSRDIKDLLAELRLNEQHHVVDLGSGDGRVLRAVVATGAKATGVEINPMLVWTARWRLRRTSAVVVMQDMWQFKLPDDTTHVFMFCAGKFMSRMDKYLTTHGCNQDKKLCVISYGFSFEGKTPMRHIGAFNIYEF